MSGGVSCLLCTMQFAAGYGFPQGLCFRRVAELNCSGSLETADAMIALSTSLCFQRLQGSLLPPQMLPPDSFPSEEGSMQGLDPCCSDVT